MSEEQRRCSKCSAPALRVSRPRGGMEQLIYVLGGSFLRCHACSDRNLYFAGMSIPADTTKHDHGVAWAIFFLVAGVLTCLAIAYLVLHKFHRF